MVAKTDRTIDKAVRTALKSLELEGISISEEAIPLIIKYAEGELDREAFVKGVVKMAEEKHPWDGADIIERDSEGNVVGWGSHADYDYYAVDVANGRGYYDSDGHFHRYAYNPED